MAKNSAPLVMDSPHTKKMKDHERDVALGKAVGEMHRINCPHCVLGAGVVTVRRKQGEAQIPAGEVIRCESCKRFFKIAVRIKLYGQKLTQ